MSRNKQVAEETVDGVTVTKEFDEDRFALPAFTYELSSERDEAVRVRLVDEPPPSLDPEQFGFHSDYGSRDWRIDDGSLVFERRLGPGETVTTVVGVREVEDTRQLLDDVDEILVTSADTAEETESASDGSDESVDEALSGVAVQPTGPPSERTEYGERSAEHETDEGDDAIPEVEDGTIADEPDSGNTDSIDARIRHLQADVADLRAYTAALEEFLDDHGSASEVVADFDDRLDAFQDDLTALETRVDANDTAIASVSADVDEVRESVDDNDAELDEVVARLQAVEAQLEDAGDLSTIADRVTSVEADVEDVNRWRETLRAALSTPDGDDV